jgi:hypothetical protein
MIRACTGQNALLRVAFAVRDEMMMEFALTLKASTGISMTLLRLLRFGAKIERRQDLPCRLPSRNLANIQRLRWCP